MLSLDSIYENLIAELIGIGVSSLIIKFSPNLLGKEKTISERNKFDALKLSLFLTSFSIFNLILNISFWNKPQLTTLLTLLSFALGFTSIYIYHNQCPVCKRFIGAKKRIDQQIIKEFKMEKKYQPMKIWLYSNGQIWKKEPIGSEKIRIENWITKQEFYECNYCKNRWDSGQININLDKNTKSPHTLIKTHRKDPNELY